MVKLAVIIFVVLTSIDAWTETYQYQLQVVSERETVDILGASFLEKNSTKIDLTAYFKDIESTEKGPIDQAAFLNRAQFVRLFYSDSEIDGTEFNGDEYGVNLRLVSVDGLFFDIGYLEQSTDFESIRVLEEKSRLLGVGGYVGGSTTVSFRYQDQKYDLGVSPSVFSGSLPKMVSHSDILNRAAESSANRTTFELKGVTSFAGEKYVSGMFLVEYVDRKNLSDGLVVGGQFDYYFSKGFSIGGAFTTEKRRSEESDSFNSYSIKGSYFITDKVGLTVSYSRLVLDKKEGVSNNQIGEPENYRIMITGRI